MPYAEALLAARGVRLPDQGANRFRVQGREFEDLGEAVTAHRAFSEAGRAGSGGAAGMVSPTQREVTLRTRTLGAASALSRLQRPRTSFQQQQYDQQVQMILRNYGFQSQDELHEMARGLGVLGSDGQVDRQQMVDARIDELIAEGLDDAEIERMLEEEGLIGG